MEKINFKDLPSTETPIDSANLNALQDNAENAINENIKIVEYKQSYTVNTGQGTTGRFTITTNVPEGYELIAYTMHSNGFLNSVITWIISSSDSNCIIAWYNVGSSNPTAEFVIKGIYKKL